MTSQTPIRKYLENHPDVELMDDVSDDRRDIHYKGDEVGFIVKGRRKPVVRFDVSTNNVRYMKARQQALFCEELASAGYSFLTLPTLSVTINTLGAHAQLLERLAGRIGKLDGGSS